MSNINKSHVFIVDGHNVFRRVFAALKQHGDEDSLDRAIAATSSTVDAIIKDIRLIKPTHVIVTFEGENGWREKYYPQYKVDKETGVRRVMSQSMKMSLLEIKRHLENKGVMSISKDGFEADDLIGYISKKLSAMNIRHTIGTNDKDIFQCVNPICTCYDRSKKTVVDSRAVFERFGVTPDQMVDFLCLVGDNTDRITGVTGIGEKKAAALLSKYGSLSNVFKNADEIGGKMGAVLADEKTQEHVQFIRKMIDIKVDIPLGLNLNEARIDISTLHPITNASPNPQHQAARHESSMECG
ncbi:5'-3' exonuclease [Aeromonas sp. 23P]|uniref:5'-3' exonuclease n=1 Tax=Aeromonas sp. 23P TaxID=3452716 RepID=UPI003F79ED10|nr:hypothetical protein [Aeromonas veronii]